MEEVGAMVLEVHSLPSCIRRNQDPKRMLFGRSVERELNGIKALASHAAVKGGDPVRNLIRASELRLQLLL